MTERACKNCEFWDRHSDTDDVGWCKRRCPKCHNGPRWAETYQGEWCGEFSAKDKGDRGSCVVAEPAAATSCTDLRSCLDCRHYDEMRKCDDSLGMCMLLLPIRRQCAGGGAFLVPWYPGGDNECKSWEKRQEEPEESCDNCWHKSNGAHCITMRSPCESYTKDCDKAEDEKTCGNCWHYRYEDGDCYEDNFTKGCGDWEPINAVKECDN